ncbi:MAG: riboflavin synthase [Zetaproteobacteria bacterium]|nr:MAG: riboflavin synthase [Zetaproteobacteria bacterium]
MAVDGCCLTVVDKGEGRLAFDLSEETLSRTRFARLAPGTRVNLEPALRVGDPLGGHWVSGHVDALGEVVELAPAEDGASFVVRLPDALLGYVAVKGSVAINGVSLTINAIEEDCIRMHLIPHTLAHTNLGEMAGSYVHVEVDLIARYLARWLEVYGVRR